MSCPVSFRRIAVVLLDLFMVLATYVMAFLLRFDFHLNAENLDIIYHTLPWVMLAYFAAALIFSLYRGMFYFASFADLINITRSIATAGVLSGLLILFHRQGQFPRSVLILHPILAFLGTSAIRFGIRLTKSHLKTFGAVHGRARYVLLVGAGDLGESLLRQIQKTFEPYYIAVGFIDDDRAKWGLHIHGVPVLGGRDALKRVLAEHEIDEIIIAISARRGEIVRVIMDAMNGMDRRPELKIAPALDEMLAAPRPGAGTLRRIKPADLLNREPVTLDIPRISWFLAGKTVLVTGAGGTIGSELCRQVLQYGPAKIILLEAHATSLFYVEAELRATAQAAVAPILGDVRDQALIDRLFKEHKPQIVLHAAAHKHVHQLQENVAEGIGNNVLGTYYLAQAAHAHGTEAFVLISTDKAVWPKSVMGATKRAAEFVVSRFAARGGVTRFAAVRFGNVLGSSGSALEIFQKQISRGGPVTVTDAKVRRYFMTVHESVQLILQSAAMARGGEIFVLKMGTPINILDMAKNLILLSGLEPGKDIEIRITGLKPGEKMEEELIEDPTNCIPSEHPSIMALRLKNVTDIDKRIVDLEIAVRTAPSSTLIQLLRELVPSFDPLADRASSV